MTRIRRHYEIELPDEADAMLDLIIGPVQGGLSEKQLEVAWEAYGEEIMGWQRPGEPWRPLGYWRFVLGEYPPRPRDSETIRLAELGELSDEEIAAIAEKANEARLRIDTDGERISGGNRDTPGAGFPDREAVELYEAVTAATKTGAPTS